MEEMTFFYVNMNMIYTGIVSSVLQTLMMAKRHVWLVPLQDLLEITTLAWMNVSLRMKHVPEADNTLMNKRFLLYK
nr:hypothetical protein Iba_chr15cCG1930 [Ipomoea batatas]